MNSLGSFVVVCDDSDPVVTLDTVPLKEPRISATVLSTFPERLCPQMSTSTRRPPLPPFTRESAIQKVRLAEDGWNTRDPEKVALAYASNSRWRNRSEFIAGRSEIIAFLSRKWSRELDYRLIKEMWSFTGNRIAVRFAYEWHDDAGRWYRSFGNENWEFNDDGLMASRFASINDLPISETDRRYHWPLGRRPDEHSGLTELGL